MEASTMDTYEGQVADLKLDYIREMGEIIDNVLTPTSDPLAIAYVPGNGTQYDLLFVPARRIFQLGDSSVPSGIGLHHAPGHERERWCVVTKVNCSASDWVYPFDLSPGNVHVATYIQSKIGGEGCFADACAITALFRAICGKEVV